MRRTPFDILELTVLKKNGVNTLEDQGEDLIRRSTHLRHLVVEVAEKMVKILSLVGEKKRPGRPNADGHFTQNAEKPKVGPDGGHIPRVFLL